MYYRTGLLARWVTSTSSSVLAAYHSLRFSTKASQPSPNSLPADRRQERQWQGAVPVVAAVNLHRLTHDLTSGNEASVAAVVGVVAIISQDKQGVGRNDQRAPVPSRGPVVVAVSAYQVLK